MVTDIISMQSVLHLRKKLTGVGRRQHVNCNVSKLVQFIAQSNFYLYAYVYIFVDCK